jgi:hypothetical protein
VKEVLLLPKNVSVVTKEQKSTLLILLVTLILVEVERIEHG